MLSQRSKLSAEQNVYSRTLAKARAKGGELLDLTVSNPTEVGLPYAESALVGSLAHPDVLRYAPEAFGMAKARAAVAAELLRAGASVPERHIVLTASTSESYAFLFKLLCDPGDEVLVPSPGYPLFDHLAAFESVRLTHYPLRYDGAWHVDVDELRARVTPRTRAVVVVTPNNPTGNFLKRSELAALQALQLPIISDEVFGAYEHVPVVGRATSALEARGALVFALGGLSKLAALPQMKLGWIACSGPEAQRDEALARLELIADAFLSVGSPVQLALPTLLEASVGLRAAILARCRENLLALSSSTEGTSLSLLPAEGGWQAVLRLPATLDDEGWALSLLESEHVVAQPGFLYDFGSGAFLVLSLLTPEPTLREGVARIVRHVAARA